jgi:hypothetical protein
MKCSDNLIKRLFEELGIMGLFDHDGFCPAGTELIENLVTAK